MEQPSAKTSRADPQIFDPNRNTEKLKREAIVRVLNDRVSKWEVRHSTALPSHIVALHASPVVDGDRPAIWLLGCQAREQSWTTTYWLQCQELMIAHARRTDPGSVTPFLRVDDGFWVTRAPADLLRDLGAVFPATFMPTVRDSVCMFIGSRVAGDAVPLRTALNADALPAQIRAVVACIWQAMTHHGITMRHVVPHNLWARPLDPAYDGVAIHPFASFAAADVANMVPQLWPDQSVATQERDLFAIMVPFDHLRDTVDKTRFAAPALDSTTAIEGQCLVSLCGALLSMIITADIRVSDKTAAQLASLLPTEAQLLDLAEEAADNTSAAAHIQRYMTALVRLRRAVLRVSAHDEWHAKVAAALKNIVPAISDGVLPLSGRYMPTFRSALGDANQAVAVEIGRPLSMQ